MKLKQLLDITEDQTLITLIKIKEYKKYETFFWGYPNDAKNDFDTENMIVVKQEPLDNGLSIWIITNARLSPVSGGI